MKLIYSGASPYARKARATAIESGMASKIEMEEITHGQTRTATAMSIRLAKSRP